MGRKLSLIHIQGIVTRNIEYEDTVTVTLVGEKENYDKGKQRFLKEAQTMAMFSKDKGIVKALDFFEINNTAYIVMEYLEGVTLKQYLRENKRIAAEDLSLIHIQMCIRDRSKIKGEKKEEEINGAWNEFSQYYKGYVYYIKQLALDENELYRQKVDGGELVGDEEEVWYDPYSEIRSFYIYNDKIYFACNCYGESEDSSEYECDIYTVNCNGDVYKRQDVSHVHSYTETITKKATCTTNGTKTFKCACGDAYEETIKATGHLHKETRNKKEATETSEGDVYKRQIPVQYVK